MIVRATTRRSCWSYVGQNKMKQTFAFICYTLHVFFWMPYVVYINQHVFNLYSVCNFCIQPTVTILRKSETNLNLRKNILIFRFSQIAYFIWTSFSLIPYVRLLVQYFTFVAVMLVYSYVDENLDWNNQWFLYRIYVSDNFLLVLYFYVYLGFFSRKIVFLLAINACRKRGVEFFLFQWLTSDRKFAKVCRFVPDMYWQLHTRV